jgi:hypothetical protein
MSKKYKQRPASTPGKSSDETPAATNSRRQDQVVAAVADVLNFVTRADVWAVLETLTPEQQLTLVNAIAVLDDTLFIANTTAEREPLAPSE